MDQARYCANSSRRSTSVQADLALLSILDIATRLRPSCRPQSTWFPVVPKTRNKPPIRRTKRHAAHIGQRIDGKHSRAIIVRCSALNNAATHTHRNGSAHSPGKNRHQEPNEIAGERPKHQTCPPKTNPCSMAFIGRLISGRDQDQCHRHGS